MGTLEGLGANLCILGIMFSLSLITYVFRKALLGEIDFKDDRRD